MVHLSLLNLDLHVDAGRQVELRQRVHRLRAAVEDVDHPLVRLQLELLPRLLVHVRGTEHRPPLRLRRERDRPRHLRPRLLRRADDVRRRLIDHRVIECLETDANSTGHDEYSRKSLVRYLRIFATTPAPTVRPPSRMAKRSPSSMAIGVISSIVICTLSPGITISIPSGSSTLPVTSVVRK